MQKWMINIGSGIALSFLLTSCDTEKSIDTPPDEDVIAWGQLTGIWQSYSGMEGNRLHQKWLYIQDSGDQLSIFDCRAPSQIHHDIYRTGNTIGSNESYYHRVVSENEIHTIDDNVANSVAGYLKVENSSEFITGSLSVDIVDNSNGIHWSRNLEDAFCAEISTYSDESWGIEIFTPNMSINLLVNQAGYVGDFTPHINSFLEIENTQDRKALIAQDGLISCLYTPTNDFQCVFDVVGLSETAAGVFTINNRYLTVINELID